MGEHFQVHEIFDLPENPRVALSDEFAHLYRKGCSLPEIAKQTGRSKDMVRSALLRAGIDLRPKVALPVHMTWREPGKRNIRPYYGFCYFQGRVVPDPREYENLLLIHRLWKAKTNPNRIATLLNTKKIPARNASTWNRNSVVLVLQRFEQAIISIKGEKYELG